jgi:hypothetical protein
VHAGTLRRSSVYTPQAVFDGSRDIVVRRLGRWNGKPREFDVNMSRLPEKVTDIALLVQSAGQGALLGAVAQSIR